MDRWNDAATWTGDGLRREVFFFGSGESRLYGSLYSAESPSRPDGVLVCSPWGFEADRTEHLSHHIALTMARLGGAGMVFHYPGFGDSHGAFLGDATMDSLASAAVEALAEAARRCPQTGWFFAGLTIGAAVACLARQASPLAANRLLLIQPALSPSTYFAELAQGTQPVTLRSGRVMEMSFAYPLPRAIVDAGREGDVPVRNALRAFDGDGAIARYARPARDELVPADFEELVVDGAWRFARQSYEGLERGLAEWLRA